MHMDPKGIALIREFIKKEISHISHSDSLNKTSVSRENYYNLTRPLFLKYAQNIETLNKDDLMYLISFAYSWMPTIPKVKYCTDIENRLNKAVLFINKVKSWDIDIAHLESYLDDLENLKWFTNNSYVWMSKVLHFINPKLFCIYDSRVLKKLIKLTGIKKISFINLNKALYDISLDTGYSMEQIDIILWA